MNIIEKINAIMAEFVMSNPEWCSDHLLVIMHEILHLAAELKKKKANSTVPQQVFDDLLVNFAAFCKLLSESDVVSVSSFSIIVELLNWMLNLSVLFVVATLSVNRRGCQLHYASLYPLLNDQRNHNQQSTIDPRCSARNNSTSF